MKEKELRDTLAATIDGKTVYLYQTSDVINSEKLRNVLLSCEGIATLHDDLQLRLRDVFARKLGLDEDMLDTIG